MKEKKYYPEITVDLKPVLENDVIEFNGQKVKSAEFEKKGNEMLYFFKMQLEEKLHQMNKENIKIHFIEHPFIDNSFIVDLTVPDEMQAFIFSDSITHFIPSINFRYNFIYPQAQNK